MADLDYNNSIYIDQCNDGLHIDIQRLLALLETKPTTMIDFANRAIALDNRLFNFRTLRTRHEPQYYRDYYTLHPRSQHYPQESTSLDPEPMELNTTQRFRVKDREEEEKW
jgi:hypothetical protein